jgi:predicted PurR-regulated permease PerM
MAASRGTVEHRRIHLSGQAALAIVGTVVGLVISQRVFVAAHRPLSWAAATAVVAVLIDPIVDRLATKIRRVPAVLLTFLTIGTVAIGITYLAFDEIQQGLDRLQEVAPEAAAAIEDRDDRLGEVARDFTLGERVDSFVKDLDDRVTGGDDVLRTTAGTAPTYLVCAILTVFLMTYGPRIATAALAQDPDAARRKRIADLVGPAVARARSAVLLTVGTAVAAGGLVSLAATLLDLPAPTALGLAAGVLALLPHVGFVVGSVPLLLVAVGFRSAASAIVLGVLVVGLQVVDSVVVRRWISARSVDIGLFVPWVVALIGYSVYGVGGAAYGVIVAVGGLAVLDGLHERNEAREAEKAAAAKPARKRAPRKAAATAKT